MRTVPQLLELLKDAGIESRLAEQAIQIHHAGQQYCVTLDYPNYYMVYRGLVARGDRDILALLYEAEQVVEYILH